MKQIAQRAKLLISTAALAGTLAGWAILAQQSQAEVSSTQEAVPEAQIPQWLLEKPVIPTLQPLTQATASSDSPAAAPPNLRNVTESMLPTPSTSQNQVTTTRRRPMPITSTRSSR